MLCIWHVLGVFAVRYNIIYVCYNVVFNYDYVVFMFFKDYSYRLLLLDCSTSYGT